MKSIKMGSGSELILHQLVESQLLALFNVIEHMAETDSVKS